MKALIAVTCVAMLAAVGYFFWGEYRAASERAATDAVIETARRAIYNESGAAPGDRDGAGKWCEMMRRLTRGELKDNSVAHLRVQQCRLLRL